MIFAEMNTVYRKNQLRLFWIFYSSEVAHTLRRVPAIYGVGLADGNFIPSPACGKG